MRVDLLRRIRADAGDLSRSEAQVAEYVQANPRAVIEGSIAELAARADVSEPTVIRFCRSMGLSGFRDLKTHLVAALQQPESYLHNDVGAQDDLDTAVGKVLDNSIRALMDLRAQAGNMPFAPAVEALREARQIIFAGLGASGAVAQDASHKFFRLGIPCSSALDAQTIAQRAAIAAPGDVFVACSHTGAWSDLINAMALAVKQGAVVIAVTDPQGPLAEVASFVFECHPPEDTSVHTPMSSRLAQLALLDALQVSLALTLGESAELRLRASKDVLYGADSPLHRAGENAKGFEGRSA